MLNSFRSFIKEDKIKELDAKFSKKAAAGDLIPKFVMAYPLNLDNSVENNIYIEELPKGKKKIDLDKALSQWSQMYRTLASNVMVYLIPPTPGLQDQCFVANLGIFLPHMRKPTIVISNFTSSPRKGEQKAGVNFFKLFSEYNIYTCPYKWEGEAELKYLKDDLYIGGYGLRTQKEALDWFEKEFKMEVIKVEMTDKHLYHLDCVLFPLSSEKVICCTSAINNEDLKAIENVAEVVDVNIKLARNSITNNCRIGEMVFSMTNLPDLKLSDDDYTTERDKVDTLTRICDDESLEPCFFNLSEMMKCGAAFSCCLMRLSYFEYQGKF